MTRKAIEAFFVGLGVTIAVTLGAALVNLGPTEDLETWGRNLLFALAGSVGSYIVNHFREMAGVTSQFSFSDAFGSKEIDELVSSPSSDD